MDTKDLIQLEAERLQWSLKTFPDATPISSMLKLQEETKEVIQDIENGVRDPEEYADCLMALFDSAGRQGIFPAEIIEHFALKLKKNKLRKWVKNPDNTYSHVKNFQKWITITNKNKKEQHAYVGIKSLCGKADPSNDVIKQSILSAKESVIDDLIACDECLKIYIHGSTEESTKG